MESVVICLQAELPDAIRQVRDKPIIVLSIVRQHILREIQASVADQRSSIRSSFKGQRHSSRRKAKGGFSAFQHGILSDVRFVSVSTIFKSLRKLNEFLFLDKTLNFGFRKSSLLHRSNQIQPNFDFDSIRQIPYNIVQQNRTRVRALAPP